MSFEMMGLYRIERDDCEDRHGEGDQGHHWEKNPPDGGNQSVVFMCIIIIHGGFFIIIIIIIIIIHINHCDRPSDGICCPLLKEASQLGSQESQASYKWWSFPG